MKVLHIITSLNKGGAENHLVELASIQARQAGNEIHIIYFRGDDYWVKFLRKKKIIIKKLDIEKNYSLLSFFFAFFKLLTYVKIMKPKIVHAHLALSEIMSVFLKIFFRLDFKIIVSKHLDSFIFEGSRGQNKFLNGIILEKIIFSTSSHIIFISKNVRKYFLSKIQIPSSKNSVIYYGIGKKNFTHSKQLNNLKIKIKKKKNEKFILNVARHTPQKRVDLLIKGFKEHCLDNKNSKLLLVGHGQETKNLKILVKKLGIENRVYWIKYTDRIYDLYKISDVFCLTSSYEGLGLVLLEALISKIPIITINNSAMKEVVTHNYTGLLLANNFNSKSLSSALQKILYNKKFSKKITENGLKVVKEKFTTKKMLHLTNNIYNKI